MDSRQIGYALAILGSAGLTVWGVCLFFQARRFLRDSYLVLARVSGYEKHELDSEGTLGHFPIVEFRDSGGASRTLKVKVGSTRPAYDIGETIPAHFNPRLDEIRLSGVAWAIPATVALIGCVLLMAFVAGALYGQRA